MYIYVYNNINFIVCFKNLNKQKYLIIYLNKKYIILKSENIEYFKYSNTLSLSTTNKPNIALHYKNEITNYLYNINNFYLQKINFKGKGYKITKKHNFLNLNFNHSHITWVILFNAMCIKINKNKYLVVLKNIKTLVNLSLNISKIRPLNIYTKRGIKQAKQRIFKKVGKRT